METAPSGSHDDLHLVRKLLVLRHLPPTARLPQPAAEEGRELMDRLLQAPEDEDPLTRLQREEPKLTARMALWYLLRFVHDRIRLHEQLQRPDLVERERRALGSLLDIRDADRLFDPLSVGPSGAAAVLEQLRGVVRSVGRSAASFVEEVDRMLWDLLETNEDPMEQIAGEWAVLAARTVLGQLVSEVDPSRQTLGEDLLGDDVRTFRPRQLIREDEMVWMRAEQVQLGEEGFTLSVRYRLTLADLPTREGPFGFTRLTWNGFNDAVDDRGYHYLRHSARGWGRMNENYFTACFYPALVPEASEIAFVSSPAVIVAVRIPPVAGQVPRHVRIEDITWRYQVPSTG